MKVLIIGNGGREHAIAWKVCQSPLVNEIFCAPGNSGTKKMAKNINISPTDIDKLLKFALTESVDLTICGPELPLTQGAYDKFEKRGLRFFGVSKLAAELEGSKVFTKNFLKKYNIPTAAFETFSDPDQAKEYIKSVKTNVVVKADGLAAGKGVYVCSSKEGAYSAIDEIMLDKKFGESGINVVVEEFLDGVEASFIALTDGKNILSLATSQDHKAAFDGDVGPNTGGMGAYSPAPVVTKELHDEIMETVIHPTVKGMEKEGRLFKGILYAGIMICNNKPKVLEFNVRFGDPETQPILMRMESDIIPVINAIIDSKLNEVTIEWKKKAATCVVMASKGYPGAYEKGMEIKGIETVNDEDSYVFYAGVKSAGEKLVTDGGRVLGVTALGDTISNSIDNAYSAVSKISFSGAHFRTDIGKKAI